MQIPLLISSFPFLIFKPDAVLIFDLQTLFRPLFPLLIWIFRCLFLLLILDLPCLIFFQIMFQNFIFSIVEFPAEFCPKGAICKVSLFFCNFAIAMISVA